MGDIAIVGPNIAYRCGQSPYGIGIGLNGGSHVNLIENTAVSNFYTLWETELRTGPAGTGLDDSNTFRNPSGYNGCVGIFFNGTETYIDDVVEPTINNTTIAIDSEFSKQVNVFGGNLSATSARNSGPLTLSDAVSAGGGTGCPGNVCISGTLPTGVDASIGTIYNSYMAVTQHFGVIPMLLTSWNSSTGAAIFALWGPWGIL